MAWAYTMTVMKLIFIRNIILSLLVAFTGLSLVLYALSKPGMFGSETARMIFTQFAMFLFILGLVSTVITIVARSKPS